MQCPFCQEEVGSADDLQIHCLVCTSAYADPSTSRVPRVDSVVVRFRWVKSRPCFEREVHLISSLAGSVILHWKEDEGLYESDTIGVPVGEHTCQLAVGGDVVSTETFEVNQGSDVIFIIIEEANFRYTAFEDSDRRTRISGGGSDRRTRISGGVSDEESEPVDTHERHDQPPLDMESRERHSETSSGMSPLYRELLRHQLSHGEPSWVPGSGVQSPVMSETDFSTLAGQQDDEPPIPGTPPDHAEELLPGLEPESRPGDLSGESDGVPSLSDGGIDEQTDNEDGVIPQLPSLSPVPSSHSEHDSRASRNSPANSVPSETGARDDSVVCPFIIEAILRENPPPITGGPSTEENTTVPPSSTPQSTPGRDHDSIEETSHLLSTAEERPPERRQSASRASPLGSVLEAITVPINSDPDALVGDHEATTPPQRHSPAGSVHSSSLFSSGLPTPIMSPRDRSQSDMGVPLVSRGSPPGSVHDQIQLPLRPQSLGGSVPTTAGLLATLGSPRGPISGAEESPLSPVHRQSPTGSNHSNIVHPQGGIGVQQAGRHSSHRNTPILSAHSGSAAVSEHGTPLAHSPRHGMSNGGSPTELLMETAYRHATPPVPSHPGSTVRTPAVRPSERQRESEHSTPISHRSSAGSPTELLMETAYRQGTTVAPSSHTGSMVTSPVVPSASSHLDHRDSGNSTPSVHSLRHRTSGTESPAETVHTGIPPALPSTGSRVSRRESEHSASSEHTPKHRTSGTGSPPVPLQGGSSRASSVHSRPERSPPHVFSPPLPRESVIPSHGSAFAAVTGERGSFAGVLPSEVEELRQERDTLAKELRVRAAHYEGELRRVKCRNEDLEQQLLSIETVATLTKQDDDKTQALEQTVVDLNRTLQEKDQEIHTLQESIRGLERTNQQLKEEQESLKTVNELRLEDMNKLNSDLQQQCLDMRRRSVEYRTKRGRDEGKIIDLQVRQNTLEQQVKRLQLENTNLHKQLKKAQQEMDTMKAGTSRNSSRLSKAKSETDLSRKYASYDKYKYADLEPVARTVSFATRGDTSGLGTARYSSFDTNYTRSRDLDVSSSLMVNGYSSTRAEPKRATASTYSSVQDRLTHEPVIGRGTVPRHRVGSLGDDSDVSDDLEHAPQPRYRTQSSESSSSSVVSWDHDYTAYNPGSVYQHDRAGSGHRRRRHHSHDGGSLHATYNDDYSSSQNMKSSPYSQSLRDGSRHSTSSLSYSTNSPLLTTTTQQSTSTKLFTKPFAPRSSSDVQMGMEVLVTRSRGQIGRGRVKYVGPLPGRTETYIGIELGPGQEGKHDGSFDGHRLFTCKPNRGIFVSFNKVVMCYG